MKYLVFAYLLLFAGISSAQNYPAKAKADSLFDLLQKHHKAMGSVCIMKNGNALYSRSFGWSEALAHVRNNDSTAFRIGSISKVFTSVMIHQLMEEGKLARTSTLSQFFPELTTYKDISISQLLDHSSGIHNFTNDDEYVSYSTRNHTHDEMLAIIGKPALDFKPGKKHEYSNSNYVLLGYIVEQLTGSVYAEEVQKRIVQKLALRHTYAGQALGTKSNEARSYEWGMSDWSSNSDWKAATETDMSIPHGAGMMVASASDLCRFMEGLMYGKLIQPKSLDVMQELHDGYGSGLFRFPFGSRYAYGHNGGIDGFQSMLAYFPDDSITVAGTFNALDMEMNDIIIGLLSIHYNKAYTLPDFKEINVVFRSDELMLYPGTYASKGFPLKISIREESGKFYAQATGQGEFPLTAISLTEFRFEPAGIQLIFQAADATKDVQHFTLKQAGQTYEFDKMVKE